MNILILSEDIPFEMVRCKGISAVNIQLFLIARALSELGHNVALLSLNQNEKAHSGDRDGIDANVIKAGKSGKFKILPPLHVAYNDSSAKRSTPIAGIKRFLMAVLGMIPVKEFYPSIRMGAGVSRRADKFDADVLLAFVSPLAAGAMAKAVNYPKIIFQGNLDHTSDRLRLDFHHLFSGPPDSNWLGLRYRLSRYIREKYVRKFETCHGQISLCADAVANTAACNNRFYEDIGHPRTVYVGTTWSDDHPDLIGRVAKTANDGSTGKPYKIIGHVGLLNMTASTFGLAYLLQEVMPALRREMQDIRFEVHIIGDGTPVDPLRGYLEQENLHLRGFVEDLNSELRDSDVFLFLNNAGPLKAIFSRQIMSWAMGLCLIAHTGSREALPELAHGENALIGSTPEELAKLVRHACLDINLNRKLRIGGRTAYEESFSPNALSQKLVSIMEDVIA